MFKGSEARARLPQLESLFASGVAGDLNDSELLDRFVRCRDSVGDAAFRSLVERHAPMVFRVCRQALKDHHAAQDAVQATFLVLARQAGSIRNRASLSSWLFGVALRASTRIRTDQERRRRYELRSLERPSARTQPQPEPNDPDLYPELHAEIQRLPEKYRVPIVLCYFEGLTHEQAATRLHWPLGTVKVRLSRARARLRSRLKRRGQALSLVPPASVLRSGQSTGISEHLVNTITMAATRSSKGITGGLVSTSVATVSQGVIRSMFFHNLKMTAALLSVLCSLGIGALVGAQRITEKGATDQPGEPAIARESDSPTTLRLFGSTDYDPATVTAVHTPFASRLDKVLVDLGSKVKRGDPLLELFSADLVEAKSNFEAARSQWLHHKAALDEKTLLAANKSISHKALADAKNDETQSRLKMKLARDRLLVHGQTEKEIENVQNEDGIQKAKIILRSRADGVVIARSAVPGNYYSAVDSLMSIANIDHIWIKGTVSEADADKVKLGQKLKVLILFSRQTIDATVTDIDKAIDAPSRSVRFRTTIPNPLGKLKAGMLVRLVLETGGQPDRLGDTADPVRKRPDVSTNERLSELERKVDRLLIEKDERSLQARTLERLEALEHKLDRLLAGQRDARP